jgi:ferritin-like metal-binding protein YciE
MLFGTSLKNLDDLFIHLLQDIYYAEHKIADNLPTMADKASNRSLKDAFDTHLFETKEQIAKLEQVFEMLDHKPEGEKCEAMKGLIKEGEQLMKDTEEGATRDSALIAAAQKIEHYEIASYGTLCHIAKILNHSQAATLLHEILEQEKNTDEKLSHMSGSIETEALQKAA